MVVRVGIVGMSEGNGHPFSFSSIVNGFSDEGLAEAGWPGIHAYVRRRDPSEFGVGDLRITHAWTQDRATTEKLCRASMIENACASLDDFRGAVDAVIIARDDPESHWPIAQPFLDAGLPVFVDKPLAVDAATLRRFIPFLEKGRLMSCSGLRYATELDEPRSRLADYGRMKLARGVVVNSWEQYGIHMLEGIFGVLRARPVAVQRHPAGHASMAVESDDGTLVLVDALDDSATTFRIDFHGTELSTAHEVRDNFGMFRRALWRFEGMIRTGEPPIPPRHTVDLMRVLIAGRRAVAGDAKVRIDDVVV
jgi:predicted dehydrogenase